MSEFRETKAQQQMISKAHLLKKKKQILRKRHMYSYLLLLCIVFFLVIGFFWLPFLRIKKLTVSELLTLDKSDVEQLVAKSISGKIWGIVPANNVFLIHKKKLIASIKNTYSTIDTVIIKKEFTSLSFTITERSPKTIWCQYLAPNSPCYFIHEDGTIFDIAGAFSNPLFFVFYTPLENRDNPIGSLVLTIEEFKRINEIQKLFATYGIKLYGYKKDTQGSESFFLSPIVLNGIPPAYILSQQNQTTETIVSKSITAFKNKTLRESQKNKFSTLEYIDIRFNDQVSFKLK